MGVPLPFAPNELLLVLAGILIATGALIPYEFIPIAFVAMVAGSMIGYGWARRVGSTVLERIAIRMHAGTAYERAMARMQRARLLSIVVARCIPAVRIQATLAAGAAGVPRRLFIEADILGIIIWTGTLITVGWLIGVPAEHYVGLVVSLLISGGLLVVLGVAGYQIARRGPSRAHATWPAVESAPMPLRVCLAVILDVSLIAVLIAGLGRVARYFELAHRVHLGIPLVPDGTYDLLVTAGIAAIAYLLLSRFSLRSTVGERVFAVRYRRLGEHTPSPQ
jgi:membrane-associated protein